MLQLAVSRQGTIQGSYYDALADSTSPVHGSLDRQTQRVAWTVGADGKTVMETGLTNLTQDQSPVLVHFPDGRTQQWLLVRLRGPENR
jgi:hypothetical protein